MQFLKILFHDPRGEIAIIEKINNHLVAKFYSDPEKVTVGHLNDTYVGCCSYREAITKGRGKKDDVVGLHSFWVDIDFNDGTHKKQGLPSEEIAQKVIDENFPQPTIEVNSGHGIHLWYVLKESVDVRRSEDKQLWEHRMKMFQDRFRKFFVVDSTHNLDRILRVPGTMNLKHEKPAPVSAIYYESNLYTWDDLKPSDKEMLSEPQNKAIDFKNNGDMPIDKISSLMSENEAFKEVFERKVRVGDGTPSAYDFSIAIHCVKAGFTPDETKETIKASFKAVEGKTSKKHYRQDYFEKTITKAKMVVESELILGFKIVKFTKYISEPPTYELHTDKGIIKLGNITELLSTSKFSQRVAEYLDFLPDLPKPKDWKPICKDLMDKMEKIDLGQDGTLQDIVEAGLERYVEDEGVTDDCVSKLFMHENKMCLTLEEFRIYMDLKRKNNIHITKLAKCMRIAGFKPERIMINDERVRAWTRCY